LPLATIRRMRARRALALEALTAENRRVLAELEEAYVQLGLALEGSQLEATAAYAELVRRVHSLERTNEELRSVQEQMLLSERKATMGQMAAEIGHELKNYLAVMQGRAEMIPLALERGQLDVARRASDVILEQASRMERLSKGLMDFSSQKKEVSATCVNTIVGRIVQFLEAGAARAGIRLLTLLEEEIPQIEADAGQIEQMTLNLVKNALDAMGRQPGQVIVSTRYVRGEDVVEISVQDEGPGISKELLEQIFKPHFSTKKGARGFGLAICHRIARNHGGSIEIESSPGKGSVFVVTLPRRQR
jgi:two-component system sensor histidine kinase HydH